MDQKDWDLIFFIICFREIELGNRLSNPFWEKHQDGLQDELEKLKILKKKVIDNIHYSNTIRYLTAAMKHG